MKFNKNDRVESVASLMVGKLGTVLFHDGSNYLPYRVDFDGVGALWMDERWLKRVESHPAILIRSDGVTTTAQLREGKTVTKEAKAVCNPADTFNFNTGGTACFQPPAVRHGLQPG